MGTLKRLFLTGLLLGSVCTPLGVYFTKHHNHQISNHNRIARQIQSPKSIRASKVSPAQTPIRHVTKFVSLKKAAQKKPNSKSVPDAVVYLKPGHKHINAYHYTFSGIDQADLQTGHDGHGKPTYKVVKNNYKFSETSVGKILVNAKNLDKVKVTTYIFGQHNSTAGMAYFKSPMVKFQNLISDKKVLMNSITFSIQARGLETCPELAFYVDYKSTGDGNLISNMKLGYFTIYSMNKRAGAFFNTWFFFIMIFLVIWIIISVITVFMPPAGTTLATVFAGVLSTINTVAFMLWTTVATWMLTEAFKILPLFGWFNHMSFHGNNSRFDNQADDPNMKFAYLGGQINPTKKNTTTRFGGDILNYEANRNNKENQNQNNQTSNNFELGLLVHSHLVSDILIDSVLTDNKNTFLFN